MTRDADARHVAARRLLRKAARDCWAADGARPAITADEEHWNIEIAPIPDSDAYLSGNGFAFGGELLLVIPADWFDTVADAGHDLIDGRFVAQVTQRDDAGRPTRVMAMRAEPHDTGPEGAEYRWVLAPADVTWQENDATLSWESPPPEPLPARPYPWAADDDPGGPRPLMA